MTSTRWDRLILRADATRLLLWPARPGVRPPDAVKIIDPIHVR